MESIFPYITDNSFHGMMMTEEDCMHRVANFADKTAFEWLYNHHALPVFHFVYSIIRNKQAAEEIVNDIFVKLWQQRESLPGILHLRAYLLRSARNGASNYLRSLHQFIDLEQVSVAHIHFEPSPERLSISKESIGIITRGINQLPPKCKLIFKLVKEDGLRYREVAELLDISVKTVETQMTIALRRLSEVLAYIKS